LSWWRVLWFLLTVVFALVVLTPLALLAYAVSLQTAPRVELDFVSVLPAMVQDWLTPYARASVDVASLCGICAAGAALLTLLIMAALWRAARGTKAKRAVKDVSLLRSKLLERDEEIERLRHRLRQVGPAGAPEPPVPLGTPEVGVEQPEG